MALSGSIQQEYYRRMQRVAQTVANVMKEELIQAFKDQGHNNTGAAVNSTEEQIVQNSEQFIVQILMNDYVSILDAGVSPGRIPYRRGSGAGRSRYIEGLKRYFKSKGLGDKEATRAAFATATVHKKQGMPTSSSKRFSRTGKRTGFISAARVNIDKRIEDAVTSDISFVVARTIESIAAQYQSV